jgi:hypothetical protein
MSTPPPGASAFVPEDVIHNGFSKIRCVLVGITVPIAVPDLTFLIPSMGTKSSGRVVR